MTLDFKANRQALKVFRIFSWTLASFARLLTAVGLSVLVLSLVSLYSSRADVAVEDVVLGPRSETPALHFSALPREPLDGGPPTVFGTVVVVHGFSATKEFMRSLDYTLARGGFEVYGVDLPGLGDSRVSMDSARLVPWFSELLADMTAKGLLSPGDIYLVGHSLGTLVVTKTAVENPDLGIRGVVALSPIFAGITETQPANYLALTGQGELPGVKEVAFEALKAGTGLDEPSLETVYGDHETGTARAAGPVQGASHISIADSREAVGATLRWLQSSAGQAGVGLPRIQTERAERGFGMFGALLSLIGLFYYLAGWLGLLGHAPRRPEAHAVVEDARVAAGLPAQPKPLALGEKAPPLPESVETARRRATELFAGTRLIPILFFAAATISAVVLGLFGAPGFLKLSGADYLASYLLIFGVIMIPALAYTGRLVKTDALVATGTRLGVPLSAALGVGLFFLTVALVGGWVTFSFTSVLPPSFRYWLVLSLSMVFAPFAAVDELARATIHDRTGFWWGLVVSIMGKMIFLVSWYVGFMLPHPPQPFMVVGPMLVAVLVFLDVIASLAYNEHGSWLAGAVFKALTLGWIVGTVFPIIV